MNSISAAVISIMIMAALAGCITVQDGAGDVHTLRIGAVIQKETQSQDGVKTSEEKTFGTWMNANTFGAGYQALTKLTLPKTCQLVMLIKNPEQYESSIEIIKAQLSTHEETLCIAEP